MVSNSIDETDFPHISLLTNRKIANLRTFTDNFILKLRFWFFSKRCSKTIQNYTKIKRIDFLVFA